MIICMIVLEDICYFAWLFPLRHRFLRECAIHRLLIIELLPAIGALFS